MVERRKVVGGAAVTEEFHPGFRNSVAAYTVSLLNPKVIARSGSSSPWPAGSSSGARRISCPRRTAAISSPAKAAPHQADRQVQRTRRRALSTTSTASWKRIADVLREFVLRAPPNLVEGFSVVPCAKPAMRWAPPTSCAACRWSTSALLLDLFTQVRPATMLDGWFESDPVKALFGFDAIVGNYASPYAPGSAYVLLHHAFGEVNGKKGLWGHAIGGMGAITQAMARAAARARRRDRDRRRRCAR